MRDDALTGDFSDPSRDAAYAFRALLDAMARPGKTVGLHGAHGPAPLSDAAAVTLLTLCDRETPIYLAPGHDSEAVRTWIAFHIGAPIVPAAQAMFALGTWEALAPHDAFAIGTPDYPDRSATLIVDCDTLDVKGARLTGPGIETESKLTLPEIAFFQRNAVLFPLGVDVIFTAGHQAAALPRTTKVEDL